MMDYWREVIALLIDGFVFGMCCKLYLKYQKDISSIQRATVLRMNSSLQSVLHNSTRKYAIVQGDVKAIGKPIRSINYPEVTGVVQRFSIKEHGIIRNASGFWADQKYTIQESYNAVPFLLTSDNYKVQVIEPLHANILDLDTIADHFEPNSLDFADQMIALFSGLRQVGLQNTEDLLKEGTVITGIGDISLSADGMLQLHPPVDEKPYVLTTMPVSSLLRRLEDTSSTYRKLTILSGIIGLALCGVVVRRWIIHRNRRRQEEAAKQQLEEIRRRRQYPRDEDLPEEQTCVVCRANPRDIIIVPCGHVCLCIDCSDNIQNDCPVCRRTIENKFVALF